MRGGGVPGDRPTKGWSGLECCACCCDEQAISACGDMPARAAYLLMGWITWTDAEGMRSSVCSTTAAAPFCWATLPWFSSCCARTTPRCCWTTGLDVRRSLRVRHRLVRSAAAICGCGAS